ncbi:MAG: hypothetical protein HYW81_02335, partial [Parcubacteria group bacterium]|nr:hypothetical protein [Parcubacteria group bacterium]
SWQNPPSNNFSYLRIFRNMVASVGSLIADRVRGLSYVDSGLEDGVTYYYAVRTVDANGSEHPDMTLASASPFAGRRGSTPPPPITALAVTDLGDGASVKLTWKNPAAHQYSSVTIYRSTDAAERGDVIFSRYRGSEFLNTRSVQADQRYYYTVVTVDANGVQSARNMRVGGIATLSLAGDGFDTDGDGLPDAWERSHGFHPRLKDVADADDDGDGLGVLGEYRNGTDPWNPDSDADGYSDGTEVQSGFDPMGLGRKVVPSGTSQGPAFAYGTPRLSSLSEEQRLASELRELLEAEFGAKGIPHTRSHWPKLVNAYVYGSYTASEIAHTLRFGPGLVHPAIPASAWRQSREYARARARGCLLAIFFVA